MSVIGFLCGMGEFATAIIATLLLYFVLKLKYIRIKIQLTRKKNKKSRRKKCLK